MKATAPVLSPTVHKALDIIFNDKETHTHTHTHTQSYTHSNTDIHVHTNIYTLSYKET